MNVAKNEMKIKEIIEKRNKIGKQQDKGNKKENKLKWKREYDEEKGNTKLDKEESKLSRKKIWMG